ncbi:hypothetical protein [Streptomyces sp. NPDC058486]|uniref:hypothetical protein n=1 Tax=unclassified Streptomyces TaxID=2593676 RepID=UPI003668528B
MSEAILRIDSLLCERSSEATGDEITLHSHGRQVWPDTDDRTYVLSTGEELAMSRELLFHDFAELPLTLRDHDELATDDDLATIKIPATEAGTGPHTRDLIGPDSHYKLRYRVGTIRY